MKDLKICTSPMASLAPSATLAISAKAKALEYAAADGDANFIRENNDEMVALYSDILQKIREAL